MGQIESILVVLDTNVVVSALLFGGTPGRHIAMWESGRIKPFLSSGITAEIIRVLSYPKFDLIEKEIEYLLYHEILPHFDIVETTKGEPIISEDPSDDAFIQCALHAGANFIVSGDKHLLSLKAYKHIRIVTVAAFLSEVGQIQMA